MTFHAAIRHVRTKHNVGLSPFPGFLTSCIPYSNFSSVAPVIAFWIVQVGTAAMLIRFAFATVTVSLLLSLPPQVVRAAAIKLPEANGSFEIPAQEWPIHPGPRAVKMFVHYPGGKLEKVTDKTGLMLSLHNWGGVYAVGTADPQQLADRHNVVAICVNYLQSGQEPLKRPEPYDFGYLQALDALRALHTVYDGLPRAGKSFDKSRIFCTGGSGGGNVTMMANKLAPRTFACIVPLCGMVRLSDDVAFDLPGGSRLNAKYSRDPANPYYLSPDAQLIRDISHPEHLQTMRQLGNEAKFILIHGESDDVCSISDVRTLVMRLQDAKFDFVPRIITTKDLDRTTYTSTGHALGDRTLIVFREADKFLLPTSPTAIHRKGPTDFDRRDEKVRYATPNGAFVISYTNGYPVGRFEAAK